MSEAAVASETLIPTPRAATLVEPLAYADGRIHDTYAWLRGNNPFGKAEIEGVDPFWVATKHADILEISRQNALFSNGEKSPTIVSQVVDARVRAMTGGSPHLLRTLIANSKIDGEPISHFEAMSYYIIVATAGHDTTSSSTAGAIWGLAQNPAELAKLHADPKLIPGLVDESIRWITPVKNFMRTAMEDTEIGGRKLSKGDWLMLCYASGNRDEDVFDSPNDFRVDRSPNKHLAFGYGAHLCLGQHLAKMEMRILWEELIPRLKSLELAGVPAMSQAVFVNGPKRLPIRFKMD